MFLVEGKSPGTELCPSDGFCHFVFHLLGLESSAGCAGWALVSYRLGEAKDWQGYWDEQGQDGVELRYVAFCDKLCAPNTRTRGGRFGGGTGRL